MLRDLAKAKPSIRWDSASAVAGDFDGRSSRGGAMLGYAGSKVYLAIQAGSRGKSLRYQYLEFGVGPGAQAAICSAPAKLEVYPLECSMEEGELPGCKATKGASGLSIVDGDCDSIHLYWDHVSNRMQWWRR
ncbi:hypothetical protein [Roseateles koreensis]|uniref:Uncharacterized protein n=1 Tax=Roseateles koreensis TaxID=2987526 RepID=A0ABT5KPF1_9BURK|nr:hypothetical protein [Roseateles koreensis]MDC8784798.1 hypothetical protein [Roseateles koreensis]